MARIAVDARPLSIPTTGIGRYTEAVLSRLLQSSHDWFLYSDRPLRSDIAVRGNVHIRTGGLKAAKLSSLYAQWQFPRWADTDQVELFWSPRHHLPLLMGANISRVVTIHDLVWKRYPQTMSRFGRVLERLLMPPSVKGAKAVIAVSDSTASELVHCIPQCAERVRTIHEAPFMSVADKPGPLGDYFLFVGTIEPRKNLLRLLEAYALYVSQLEQPLPLKICGGRGWGLPALAERLQVLGITDQVEVLGYVGDDKLPDLYREARALLIPSLYEGFGLPIVEAFSQGTPVLTSDRGAMAEVAGDAGLLVDPESTSTIAAALESRTDGTDLVSVLQQRALERAGVFSWDTAAAQTLATMESLLPP